MSDEYVSDAFIYMRERRLGYPVFDADNHMYENRDALTKFIPPEYEGIIKYVDIKGRTKLAIRSPLPVRPKLRRTSSVSTSVPA